jgi:hypothetical protein
VIISDFGPVPPVGLEPRADSTQNHAILTEGGAKSGAPDGEPAEIDRGLAELIATWPSLPEPIRSGILAMVRAAIG